MRFELVRYNPRRKMRGVEAAEVKVTNDDGSACILWMSKRDCERNMDESLVGDDLSGLQDALQAYEDNRERPFPGG